jgi:hypothetical protein
MTDAQPRDPVKRDRSPKFPYIGLAKALERIEVLYAKAKRYDARVLDIAKDWDLSPKSSGTDRTIAAIQSFGLIEDSGSGENRRIKISDLGARIILDKRPGVREGLLSEVALKPPAVAEYAKLWRGGRPDDPHALSQLQFEGGYTADAARIFLRVFDETIRFTSEGQHDKNIDSPANEFQVDEQMDEVQEKSHSGRSLFQRLKDSVPPPTMDGERVLTTGLLSREAGFRLIVNGPIGVKEIERLIKKLELDKEILADGEDKELF